MVFIPNFIVNNSPVSTPKSIARHCVRLASNFPSPRKQCALYLPRKSPCILKSRTSSTFPEICGERFAVRVLPRIQIHLSTAVLMMFAAGGMIWVNTFGHKIVWGVDETWELDDVDKDHYFLAGLMSERHPLFGTPEADREHSEQAIFVYGWPLRITRQFTFDMTKGKIRTPVDNWYSKFDYGSLTVDASIALLVVFGIGFAIEWQTQRRSRNVETLK